jgi:hypothetical protein
MPKYFSRLGWTLQGHGSPSHALRPFSARRCILVKGWNGSCRRYGGELSGSKGGFIFIDPQFDIFKKLPDGHPIWVTAVVGLEEAKRELQQMSRVEPAEYFIFSVRDGEVVPT